MSQSLQPNMYGWTLERHILEIQRVDVEVGTQETLLEIDHEEARSRRMRHPVNAIRQYEAHVAGPQRPLGRADVVPGAARKIHLDLEVLVPVRLLDACYALLVVNPEVGTHRAFRQRISPDGAGHLGHVESLR